MSTSLSLQGWLQIGLYLVVVLLLVRPLGAYMAAVYEGRRTFLSPLLEPLERLTYRVCRVDPAAEQDWRGVFFPRIARMSSSTPAACGPKPSGSNSRAALVKAELNRSSSRVSGRVFPTPQRASTATLPSGATIMLKTPSLASTRRFES